MTGQVFPRFLGVDSNGDNVWELASGRWTWGDTPRDAEYRVRTFTPDRYLEKYGPIEPLEPSGLIGHVAGQSRVTEPVAAQPKQESWIGSLAAAEPVAAPVSLPRPTPEELSQLYPRMEAEKKAQGAAERKTALNTMLSVLTDWIRGAYDNHESMQHKYEGRGEECWRMFSAADIRNMINDAARELEIDEFHVPLAGCAAEDVVGK